MFFLDLDVTKRQPFSSLWSPSSHLCSHILINYKSLLKVCLQYDVCVCWGGWGWWVEIPTFYVLHQDSTSEFCKSHLQMNFDQTLCVSSS